MNYLRILVTLRALVVLCLRCRAWVALPVDEFDNVLSFLDEFLLLEPPVGRKVRDRARG